MLNSVAFSLASFLLLISIIVVFHELGHYWIGRLVGANVDAFSIGFGPKLFGWTDRLGTQWKVCLLPLGGYVKFSGDANSASLPDREEIERLRAKMIADGIDPKRIFQLKPIWQRFIVVLAGPVANFVLAMAIFIGVFSLVGERLEPVTVDQVVAGSRAESAGLKAGDRIVAIDGWKLYSRADLFIQVSSAPNEPLVFTVERSGQTFKVTISPEAKMLKADGDTGPATRGGQIGIMMRKPDSSVIYHHGPISAAARGYHLTTLNIDRTFHYLKEVVTGRTTADQLRGPVGIAVASGEVAKTGPVGFLMFIALVSVSVGMVNLFPVPVLDGGHLLFYAIEAIQGRPLSHRLQEIGFRIGLALLALLFVFVTWNDVLYHLPRAGGP